MGFRPLKPGSYFFALDGCWGSVHYCREEMKIQIRYGTIRLKQIAAPFEAVKQTQMIGLSPGMTQLKKEIEKFPHFTRKTFGALSGFWLKLQ